MTVRTPLLSVRDLQVEYLNPSETVVAVEGVSFDIFPGEILGLAGESGSGKSTAAKAMLRLLAPPAVITRGSVRLTTGDLDEDLLTLDDAGLRRVRWRKAALVFQSAMNVLNPVLTVGEQIADVIVAHERVSARTAMERAEALLDLVGIEAGRSRAYPHQLSGGMRQRVVIAIALALDPPLLVMDEPTTALDVVVQREILAELARLQAQRAFSVLFITHDLPLLLELATRIGVMYAGRLVEVATAERIATSPRHPYTRGLISSFPRLHGARRRLSGIGGSPPDMRHPPGGCRFHPRCTHAIACCRTDAPDLASLGRDHRAACHVLP
jgi:peptide/nickel transport system ATP-binding protein